MKLYRVDPAPATGPLRFHAAQPGQPGQPVAACHNLVNLAVGSPVELEDVAPENLCKRPGCVAARREARS